MKIVQLIPGSGNAFYCENCLRDCTLFQELHKQGHDVLRLPLYLPISSDELEHHTSKTIFFGGINVYLQQKSALFRKTPRWLDKLLDHPKLLKWAAGRGGMTEAAELGNLTLSMLRGEEGMQVKEVERLVSWLATQERPDVVHFSNALLLGVARRIKQELNTSIVCSLQDEDIWIDALPEPQRQMVWDTLMERAEDVDAFMAVSKYYGDEMCERIKIPCENVHVVYNGIDTENYHTTDTPINPPVLGFLERQCPEKGMEVLVEAFIILKKNGRIPGLKLRAAGGSLVEDKPFLKKIQKRLTSENVADDVEILPNLDFENRLEFLHSLSVMSVPAEHAEAFGIYIIEALASGIPVVQPNNGAFPELLDMLGGGILYEPNEPQKLAESIESLLLDPQRIRELGKIGRENVLKKFSVKNTAQDMVKVWESVS